MSKVHQNYLAAKELYASIGVDTDKAIETIKQIPISMHCWQGDDVQGFESAGPLTGGIQVTGNYPGKARNIDELMADIEKSLSLIPGKHRINLHAIYGDFGGKKVERDAILPQHFAAWVDFAKKNGVALDFNPTYFSHPLSDVATLSSADEGIRKYWVDHGIASRKISEYFGKELGEASVMNIWIPDGSKEVPVDMFGPRLRLKKSLDEIYAEDISKKYVKDAIESKLFGIGAESYTVGNNEFYVSYATKNNKMVCFDMGHFHPTEMVADKLPSALCFMDEVLLHLSRPVRWDSDHVTNFNDEVSAVMKCIVRADLVGRTNIALDYFDATINRVAAWVVGMRASLRALMHALLDPVTVLKEYENTGDFTSRLAMSEELKSFPFGAVWDYYCELSGVPVRGEWLPEAKRYEKEVLSKR
ncbi:MAG: L-rhamnose isomerase [Christensenellales bacterium]